MAITRAGSSALAELLNFNLPIISIPLKTSADNHQFKNAQYFERKGYGIMLEENNIEKELFDILKSMLKSKTRLNLIKQNQNKYSDKQVFINIEKEIQNLFYEN